MQDEVPIKQLEYAGNGLVGLIIPRESTTVEPEISVLLGPDVALLSMKMPYGGGSRFEAMRENGRRIPTYTAAFDKAPIDVFGFSLTATSYLMPIPEVPTMVAHAGREVPVVLAATAVRKALDDLGAKKVAIVSPYWTELTTEAVAHYNEHGFSVTQIVPVGPAKVGHSIYGLRGRDILASILVVDRAGIDAIVVTGTGAPSLAALAAVQSRDGVPILSSNFCLGWRLAAQINRGPALAIRDWLSRDAPWKQELARRYPRAVADLEFSEMRAGG